VDWGLLPREDEKIGVKAIMSLSGQWVARYTGANPGTIVIEIDEVGDHYEGAACAWDNDPSHPNSLVRFRTPSKKLSQTMPGLQVVPMDNSCIDRIPKFGALVRIKAAEIGGDILHQRIAPHGNLPVCVVPTDRLERRRVVLRAGYPFGLSTAAWTVSALDPQTAGMAIARPIPLSARIRRV
jgi:hypothetical protein